MDTTTIDTPASPSSVLPDYSTSIRAQIEETVKRLEGDMENKGYSDDYHPVYDVSAQYVMVGYIINTHHGYPIYGEGDMVCGLPVRLDRNHPRSITVCADDVEFESESEEVDYGKTGYVTRVRYFRENLSETATW